MAVQITWGTHALRLSLPNFAGEFGKCCPHSTWQNSGGTGGPTSLISPALIAHPVSQRHAPWDTGWCVRTIIHLFTSIHRRCTFIHGISSITKLHPKFGKSYISWRCFWQFQPHVFFNGCHHQNQVRFWQKYATKLNIASSLHVRAIYMLNFDY